MLLNIAHDVFVGCRVLDIGIGHHLLQPDSTSTYTDLLAQYGINTHQVLCVHTICVLYYSTCI